MTDIKPVALAYDFTPKEVAKLLAMQDELNTYIHPEWKTQGFNWGLAIIDECMEIHGHLGWKWWKKDYQVGLTESNRKQVQLEVIDILHFVLSLWIEDGPDADLIAYHFNGLDFNLSVVQELPGILEGAVANDLDPRDWRDLAHSVGLTKQEILETYIQKFVLNKFRQDHGYKTGEYKKLWKVSTGVCDDQWEIQEDNYWLEKIAGNSTDEHELYNALKQLYDSALNQLP